MSRLVKWFAVIMVCAGLSISGLGIYEWQKNKMPFAAVADLKEKVETYTMPPIPVMSVCQAFDAGMLVNFITKDEVNYRLVLYRPDVKAPDKNVFVLIRFDKNGDPDYVWRGTFGKDGKFVVKDQARFTNWIKKYGEDLCNALGVPATKIEAPMKGA